MEENEIWGTNEMRIAICDDEKKLRNSLRRVLETQLQLDGVDYEIQEYECGEDLLAKIEHNVPDILFLDIEMNGMDGMETARELRRKYQDTVLIFVTAYPDFVFQGYEVHAFHYILKPYKEEKIREVLGKAVEETGLSQEKYYLVEQKAGTLRLPFGRVLYFKSEGRTVEALLDNGDMEASAAYEIVKFYGKLGEIEEEMPSFFIRIHNRYLVNLKYVDKLEASSLECGGQSLPDSRAYKQATAVAFAKLMLK